MSDDQCQQHRWELADFANKEELARYFHNCQSEGRTKSFAGIEFHLEEHDALSGLLARHSCGATIDAEYGFVTELHLVNFTPKSEVVFPLPCLTRLNMIWTYLGPTSAGYMRFPEQLQELRLHKNDLGPQGTKYLSLPKNLQTLCITGNNIGAQGVQDLHLPSDLRELNITGNQIGPDGASHLKLPERLEILDIEWNELRSQGVRNLQLPPRLRALAIGWNGLVPIDYEYLQQRYPHIQELR